MGKLRHVIRGLDHEDILHGRYWTQVKNTEMMCGNGEYVEKMHEE